MELEESHWVHILFTVELVVDSDFAIDFKDFSLTAVTNVRSVCLHAIGWLISLSKTEMNALAWFTVNQPFHNFLIFIISLSIGIRCRDKQPAKPSERPSACITSNRNGNERSTQWVNLLQYVRFHKFPLEALLKAFSPKIPEISYRDHKCENAQQTKLLLKFLIQ